MTQGTATMDEGGESQTVKGDIDEVPHNDTATTTKAVEQFTRDYSCSSEQDPSETINRSRNGVFDSL